MRRKNIGFFDTYKGNALLSLLSGIAVTIVCLLLFAFAMTGMDMSDGLISSLASISVCIGSYFFSYLVAKKQRKNGILIGLFCGGAAFLLLMLFNLIFVRVPFSEIFFPKLSMLVICSVIGGIIGVNSTIKI